MRYFLSPFLLFTIAAACFPQAKITVFIDAEKPNLTTTTQIRAELSKLKDIQLVTSKNEAQYVFSGIFRTDTDQWHGYSDYIWDGSVGSGPDGIIFGMISVKLNDPAGNTVYQKTRIVQRKTRNAGINWIVPIGETVKDMSKKMRWN
jgi:hypothetical protein